MFELEKVTKACKKDRDFVKMEKGHAKKSSEHICLDLPNKSSTSYVMAGCVLFA